MSSGSLSNDGSSETLVATELTLGEIGAEVDCNELDVLEIRIELTIPELEKYSNFLQWVDVCKGWQEPNTI